MKYNPLSRRMFLAASGQALFSIPLLTSLLPREARAAAEANPPLRFVMINNIWSPNEITFFGRLKTAEIPFSVGVGNQLAPSVNYFNLSKMSGDMSYILASFGNLKNKMNVIRGLDLYAAEGGAHPPGLASAASGNGASYRYPASKQVSVDTMISKIAYAAGHPANRRHMSMSPEYRGWADRGGMYSQQTQSATFIDNPNDPVGGVTFVGGLSSTQSLLERFFIGTSAAAENSKVDRRNILGQIYEDYKGIRDSRQIGAEDKLRLDSYLSLISEIETGMDTAQSGGLCASPSLEKESPPPILTKSDSESAAAYTARQTTATNDWIAKQAGAQTQIRMRNHNKVIAAALACDVTRVVSIGIADAGSHSYHHASNMHLKNENSSPEAAAYFGKHRAIGNHVSSLISTLDSLNEGGKTILDNSIVYWNQMYGCVTTSGGGHSRKNFPVVVAGGAGGQLKTGNYIDYRFGPANALQGLPLNNLLVTFLNCFGAGSSVFENRAGAGYGSYDTAGALALPSSIISATGRRSALPYLYNGSYRG